MTLFSIVSVGTHETPNLSACKLILDDLAMRYTHEVDGARAIRLSRGRINPSGGFVIVAPDEAVLLDYFDLTRWVEDRGVRPI